MQCKVIISNCEMGFKKIDRVQEDINQWLKANPSAKINKIVQTSVGPNILTSIFFD
jgi:hypothetical protein